MKKQPVLVIVGPTASGKSALSVRLAKKFNGEIISADSRQVYKNLNIGTGKITKKEMGGIHHHLLDVADPKKQFTVAGYKRLADFALRNIAAKNKLPIIVGGTGFYIDALTEGISLPEVPPNIKLRKQLGKKSLGELFRMIKKKDPDRARSIDKYNKVRLIRALEIIGALGKVPTRQPARSTSFRFIFIGMNPPAGGKDLDERIYKKLMERLEGMILEGKKLHGYGLSYKRMYELGLEYRYIGMYLQNKITKKEFAEKLFIAIRQYAKRQMTWFKRNKKIKWFKPEKYREIEKYVRMALLGD